MPNPITIARNRVVGQKGMTDSAPVALASDQTPLPTSDLATITTLRPLTVADLRYCSVAEVQFKQVTRPITLYRDLDNATIQLTGFFDQGYTRTFDQVTADGVYKIEGGAFFRYDPGDSAPVCLIRGAL